MLTATVTAMPTIAPVPRLTPLEFCVSLLGKVDPVGVALAVVVGVEVLSVGELVGVVEGLVVWGLPDRKAARADELLLNLAGASLLAGHEPLVHGLLVQHPRNGGLFFWQEYHCAVLLLHA